MFTQIINWLLGWILKKPTTDEFTFGKDDVLGKDLNFDTDRLPMGMLFCGGTGSGKTRRGLIPFLMGLFNLRLRQDEETEWAALFIDPKLSFAAGLIDFIKSNGMEGELDVLSETESVRINPLLSGLSGAKISEMLVKSLLAGKPVTASAGAAYYESRALALLGHVITVAIYTTHPSLRLVADMIDALTLGTMLESNAADAVEAMKRIAIFMEGEEKERKMVLDSIQNYLEPFRAAPWRKIFFEGGPFTLDEVRDEGRFMVAAFSPTKVNHLSSGLFLLKQLWYATIMDRLSTGFKGNKERLCLLVVDEFQQVASGGSDADFLAVRREAKGCPVLAFQQISQLRTVIPHEWENILGLINTQVFLRQTDMETALYAEKICGFIENSVDAVTKTSDSLNLFYTESSRTTTRQLHPRIPAEYFLQLPDGDVVIVTGERYIAWLPAAGMTPAMEKAWRKKRWPHRPRLVHPEDFRQ
jgi:hypothetical protein